MAETHCPELGGELCDRGCGALCNLRLARSRSCPQCLAPITELTGHVEMDRIASWSCGQCGHAWARVFQEPITEPLQ